MPKKTKTMAKIKIKREIETEIDIDFPWHGKSGKTFYKVESLTDCISVRAHEKEYCIECHPNHMDRVIQNLLLDGKQCSKTDFEAAFRKALSHINHALFMEISEPVLNEDQINDLFERNEGVDLKLLA